MSDTMSQEPANSPLMLAWKTYMQTDDYANTEHWATNPLHVRGSLWAAYSQGYKDAQLKERDQLRKE